MAALPRHALTSAIAQYAYAQMPQIWAPDDLIPLALWHPATATTTQQLLASVPRDERCMVFGAAMEQCRALPVLEALMMPGEDAVAFIREGKQCALARYRKPNAPPNEDHQVVQDNAVWADAIFHCNQGLIELLMQHKGTFTPHPLCPSPLWAFGYVSNGTTREFMQMVAQCPLVSSTVFLRQNSEYPREWDDLSYHEMLKLWKRQDKSFGPTIGEQIDEWLAGCEEELADYVPGQVEDEDDEVARGEQYRWGHAHHAKAGLTFLQSLVRRLEPKWQALEVGKADGFPLWAVKLVYAFL